MVHVVLPNILQVLLYRPDLSQINPLERSMDHIVDEDAEDQDGRTDGHDGIVIGPIPFDGQAGEGEAQERAAGVSQEDCRRSLRSEVVGKKDQAGADQRDGNPGQGRLVGLERNNPEKKAMMIAMPVASPSIPSKKLNALVMPTIHSTVSSTLSASPQTLCGKKVSSFPAQMTIAAATIWTTSLTVAGTGRISSRTPIKRSSVPPASTPSIPSFNTSGAANPAVLARIAMRKARYTATPPSCGVADSWIFREEGWSTAPTRRAMRRMSGVRAVATKYETSRI